MRPNRWVLLISFIIGGAGLWSYLEAVQDYRSTAEAYTSVDAAYVPGTFVWLDPEYRTAEADFVISNRSGTDATIDYLVLRLYFDGRFAGSQYRPWTPVEVPRDSELTVTLPFEVAITELRPRAPESELTVRGEMRLEFDGIEQALTVSLRGDIGRVSTVEN